LELAPDPDGAGHVLSWSVEVRDGAIDAVLLPIVPTAPVPRRVRMALQAQGSPSWVRLVLEGPEGERWSAPLRPLPAGERVQVDLPLGAFAPEWSGGSRWSAAPAAVRALVVEDLTAFHSTERGPSRILFDDVDVR
jgi:hypothetical protein